MAETKVSGRDYILLADINNDGTYKPIACLTSNSLTSTLGTIDATSKCGDQYTPNQSFNQSFVFFTTKYSMDCHIQLSQ